VVDPPDLLAFGAVAVDDILFLDRFPDENTKSPVLKRERHAGGLAGTALVTAARLGSRAGYCGVFGEGSLSRFILEAFRRENVDTTFCQVKQGAGPIHSTILVNQTRDSRTILYSPEQFTIPDISEIPDSVWHNVRLVFLDSFISAIFPDIVQAARRSKIPLIADIESLDGFASLEVIEKINHLIVNIRIGKAISARSAPDEILRALETKHRQCTVITDGENGCWFKERGKAIYHMPAFEVPVVDTTGCGDVFHGAYTAALLNNKPIRKAVVEASAAAALKAGKPGGQAGIPVQEELMAFLNETPLRPSPF